LLKRESKHSHQHEVRYLNYLKQIKEGSLWNDFNRNKMRKRKWRMDVKNNRK
jgi:hypothetical protein